VKNIIADTKSLIMKLPKIGKPFWQNSLAGYLFSLPHPRDAVVFIKYWALTWIGILKFVVQLLFNMGPIGFVRTLINNPWILILLRVNGLARRLVIGRSGLYLDSICMTVHSIAMGVVEQLRDMFFYPDSLVINEDIIPYDILQAMGLKAYMLEAMAIILPILASECDLKYIDEAENEGMNPDACSLPKATVGMVLKGHMPRGIAMVSSNMPCDAGAGSYAFFQRAFNIPVYRLDVPFHFYNERAERLFAKDLMDMIAWLEVHTPGRMNWGRLKEVCKKRNHMLELELELWDMLRSRPSPIATEAVILSHLWHFNVTPGSEASLKHYEKLVEIGHKNLKKGISATEKEKYRGGLWNPPFCHFVDIFGWAERTYGLIGIMDSMTYNHHIPVDTSTPESMLQGLGRIIMQGPMVRHTRGPAKNYLDDIFRMVKQFDLDMILIANHVGCKSGQAMNGVLREICREKRIPLLILDYDLLDPRIVSHDNMIRQMEHFMDNVMKAPRITQ
jgi:benzoyl-CoA reductase/2-hydroxyglutaryl-CoA dehydratase subunit BcrC/BadD/HgdB